MHCKPARSKNKDRGIFIANSKDRNKKCSERRWGQGNIF